MKMAKDGELRFLVLARWRYRVIFSGKRRRAQLLDATELEGTPIAQLVVPTTG